jgi:hypothetical protein
MAARGRPRKLKDEIKVWIIDLIKKKEKKLTVSEIQEEMRLYLREMVEKENQWTAEQIRAEVEERLLSKSSIQQFVKGYYRDLKKPSAIDTPWHLGSLELSTKIDEQSLPIFSSEDISNILNVLNWLSKQKNMSPVTIRQAKWISRLHTVLAKNQKNWHKPVERAIWKASLIYSAYELYSQLIGIQPDTTKMDSALLRGEPEFTLEALVNTPGVERAVDSYLYQNKGLGLVKDYLKYEEGDD